MPTVGSGISGQVGYSIPEATAGLAQPVTQFVPFLSETLMQDRGRVDSKSIIAGRLFPDSNMWNGGNIKVGGDVKHELYNRGIGKLMTAMFGTVTSTTGPVNGLYTHTWASAGLPLPITVQKGAPSILAVVHPLTYTGSMVSQWVLACKAGEIVSFAATFASMFEIGLRTVVDGVTTSASPTVTSITAAFRQDDIGKPISGAGIPALTYIGIVNSATSVGLSSSNTTNTPVNATATATSVTFTMGIALASASYPSAPALRPFKYNHGSLSLGGAPLKGKSFTMTGKNGLFTDRWFIGQRNREQPIVADLHDISGNVEIEFTDRTQYDRYITEANYPLVIGLTNYAGESVTFSMSVRIDGETPKVAGRAIVGQTLSFSASAGTDAAAFSVVVVSADSTP